MANEFLKETLQIIQLGCFYLWLQDFNFFFFQNPRDYLVTKVKFLSKYLHVDAVLITLF